MLMIRTIIRPEFADMVLEKLLEKGFSATTRVEVFGREKLFDDMGFSEIPKTMLIIVIEDERKQELIDIIMENAQTGEIGDGRIFVSKIYDAYTISTKTRGL